MPALPLRTDPMRSVLCALGALGAVLLVVSELLPLYDVTVGTPGITRSTVTAWHNNAFAMLLLGLVALALALGALRGARPAMAGLAGVGLVAVVIALTVDLPAVRQQGTLFQTSYEDARAQARAGFFAETLGAILVLGAGGGLLLGARAASARRTASPSADPAG